MGLKAAFTAQNERHKAKMEGKRATPLEPQVVIYDSAKEFQKDAGKRLAEGWTVAGQSQGQGRVTATRVAMLGPLGILAKKGSKVTITWIPPETPTA